MYGPAALRSVAVAVTFAATPVLTTVGPPTVLVIGIVCGIAVWNGWTAEGFVERLGHLHRAALRAGSGSGRTPDVGGAAEGRNIATAARKTVPFRELLHLNKQLAETLRAGSE